MGDHDDGRLELDELGAVIDRASTLDPGHEVLEGRDGVTWGERLESSGVTPWLRRHRVTLSAGAAAAVVLGVGATAWVRSRPPAPDTTVAVSVRDFVGGDGPAGLTYAGPGTYVEVLTAIPRREGRTARILGLVGPGVRATSAHPRSTTPASDGSTVADVTVVMGCDDPRLFSADSGSFRVKVEEIDSYGRSTIGDVPLPEAAGSQWVDFTLGPCLQQVVSETVLPTSVMIDGSVATGTLDVSARVHNGYGHDVVVSSLQYQQPTVFVHGGEVPVATAHDAEVRSSLRVDDCTDPRLDPVYLADSMVGPSSPTPGIPLTVVPLDLQQIGSTTISVPFTAAQQRAVDVLLRQMCGGLPRTAAHVVAARTAPIDPATGLTSDGDLMTVPLRMTVDVATSAARVLLTDGLAPEDIRNGATPTISTTSAATSHGRAELDVDWAVSCSGVSSPPVVQLQVSSGSRTWPVRATLSDRPLLTAYRAACPQLANEDFAGMGWPSA